MRYPRTLLCSACLCAATASLARVTPAPLFQDHAVLQQGIPLTVWGTADEGERVTVKFAGRRGTATAHAGKWTLQLPAFAAGGPHTMTIVGRDNQVVLTDLLVGEVWLCSGQSNMEVVLGPSKGLQSIRLWEQEVAAADFPQIRYFGVPHMRTYDPQTRVGGSWTACTPATAPGFSATAFFFGRAVHQARHVPVGLICSSWGGTSAEAWMSATGLDGQPDFAEARAQLAAMHADPAAARIALVQQLAAWYQLHDPGSAPATPWSAGTLDTTGWPVMRLPTTWEKAGLKKFDGVVWFRREFELPPGWAGAPAELQLGPIDDVDTTWVNGHQVGSISQWDTPRVYPLPAGLLHPGRNVVAVRVLDTGGDGGLWGDGHALRLVKTDPEQPAEIPLDGAWSYQVGVDFAATPHPPADLTGSNSAPGMLFNGMIAPLRPYGIRGVIWYQGENNGPRARQYRTLFPALIDDWRRNWGQGDFPFLFVQIAPYDGMPPEIREAQWLTLARTANTAMVVTVDIGDAHDIHPPDKRPVGERLALAARALAYREPIEYSGPQFASLSVQAGCAVLKFTHLGGGLVAPGGELHGFTLAGADGIFHPTTALIVGDTVEVRSTEVGTPVAVRYGWAEVPVANLFNRAGLPASPFRSDVD